MTRRCIVTGASRGIGRVLAQELATEYEIIGVSRQRPDDWEGCFIEADLGTEEGITGACAEIARFDSVWGIINNAGRGSVAALAEVKFEPMFEVYLLNVFAAALLTGAASSRMIDGGRIINICSVGMLGQPDRTVYSGTKGALASMTRTWAMELAPRRITANAISPGPIETELVRKATPVGSEAEQSLLAAVPLHRFGTPSDLTAMIRTLLDPATSYCTGQIIGIDGGMSAGRSAV